MLQFLAVAITLLGIYRQLHAQRAATSSALRTTLLTDWEGERMVRMRLAALADVMADKPNLTMAMFGLGNWIENLGDLKWRGLVEPDFAWISFREDIEALWRDFASRIRMVREDNPEFWIRFEELATDCALRDRRAGVRPLIDLEPRLEQRREYAAQLVELLRLEKEFRDGMVPEVPEFSPSPTQGDGHAAGSVDEAPGRPSN
jgi:hypothetical protein